jgi:hypothetical protein
MRPRRRAEAPGYPREARLRELERIMYSKTIKVRIYSCDFTAQTHRGDPAGKEFSTRSAPQMMHFTELYNHCRFSVAIPPGVVEVALRYRPWDALLSIAG